MPTHAAVWIDQAEARIFHIHSSAADGLHRDLVDETTILAPHHRIHRHPKDREVVAPDPGDTTRFFEQIAHALRGTDEILILGPASAKLELFRYLHDHEHPIGAKVVGIETVEHPTDLEIIAFARKAFVRTDHREF